MPVGKGVCVCERETEGEKEGRREKAWERKGERERLILLSFRTTVLDHLVFLEWKKLDKHLYQQKPGHPKEKSRWLYLNFFRGKDARVSSASWH